MKTSTEQGGDMGECTPTAAPVLYKPELIPDALLAHAGVFTHDMKEYYFTLSDANFSQFTVMYIRQSDEQWSQPKEAFFNSSYFEHGVHFSEDGQWVYFSSTRPIEERESSSIWRIWRSTKTQHGWSEPEWVNFSGLNGKMVSHPSLTRSGRIYFHGANPDYTDFALYVAESVDGAFQKANKVILPEETNQNTITPFVAPDESYLLYAKLLDGGEEMYISYREHGVWQEPQRLNDRVNTNNLANPYVTPDGEYLFYASGHTPSDAPPANWVIKRVCVKGAFNR